MSRNVNRSSIGTEVLVQGIVVNDHWGSQIEVRGLTELVRLIGPRLATAYNDEAAGESSGIGAARAGDDRG